MNHPIYSVVIHALYCCWCYCYLYVRHVSSFSASAKAKGEKKIQYDGIDVAKKKMLPYEFASLCL